MNRRSKGFTLIELLVVISIIGILAGLTVGVSRLAGDKMRRSRVKAELQHLVTAIEAYKAKFGVYPPDNKMNLLNRIVERHQLYYELTGCLLTQNRQFQEQMFQTLLTTSDLNVAAKTLGVDGFLNASMDLKEVKNFLPNLKTNQVAATNIFPGNKPLWMLNVPVKGIDAKRPNFNPWRYNSSNPTNNPGQFDLWAEVVIGGKQFTFGNWNE
jgi:prepilin-type N-terminal cleavage/methylation domain-containing protein